MATLGLESSDSKSPREAPGCGASRQAVTQNANCERRV